MRRILSINRFALISLVVLSSACVSVWAGEDQTREAMKGSIVYLEISSYGYDQLRPWKNTDVQQKGGVGCATGAYQMITPAWNLIDAKLIKAKVSGQNEYVPVKIKTIDYEIDLALLELEPNTMKKPLKPIKFADKFQRGTKLNYYWLNHVGEMTTGQGYLDRAEVLSSTVSYTYLLNMVVTNTSQETGIGQVFCDGTTPIGIACWGEGTRETGLIPALTINDFLTRVKDANYPGIPAVGFATEGLLDPAMRTYLKMPATMKNGVQVTNVYTIGTGSESLKAGDVILAIDGKELDAYGKFLHPAYDRIMFHHLITSHKIGDDIVFDIWRDGGKQQLRVQAKNFDVGEMLVPYYEYGHQPEYVVTGGFVFQKLTRSYLANWGKDWDGKVTPHLLHYLRDMAFKPTAQRREIVILSYVLPAQINLGYTDLSQLVVSKFNGMPISRISDIVKAQKLNPGAKYDVVEFELDNPTVVIPRQQLPQADAMLATSYGIRKLVNVNP
ncbi:MAG: PDZ domain-containing protein [Sedimentisphaerales bacterium]